MLANETDRPSTLPTLRKRTAQKDWRDIEIVQRRRLLRPFRCRNLKSASGLQAVFRFRSALW
ncbi:hypothetical protein ACFTZI_11120 [Streptomyces decoyicus]|uniref:hypothetical protein n=1 Tax=Streptomyces decoyicus TaxID=249567 RepID=UPI0036348C82